MFPAQKRFVFSPLPSYSAKPNIGNTQVKNRHARLRLTWGRYGDQPCSWQWARYNSLLTGPLKRGIKYYLYNIKYMYK